MNKLKLMAISCLFVVFFPLNIGWASELSLSAQAYILLDGFTGHVLLAKNADEHRPPASTTKMVTAILALEQGNLEEITIVSPKAAAVGEATIDLEPGERISILNLVRGALIKSGNDATVALAEEIAGTEEIFVVLMNRKARLLGAVHTYFENTNGLPQNNHFSTARDLALIARYCLQNEVFQEIVSTKEIKIPWDGKKWDRYLKNTNKLLWSYAGADGVKTGTTREAGGCLVASATREGRQLIAVVLKSSNRFQEAARLLDYGFQHTVTEIIAQGTEFGAVYSPKSENYRVPLVIPHDFVFAMPVGKKLEKKVFIDKSLRGKVDKGSKVGDLVLEVDQQELARLPLLVADEVYLNDY